MPRCDRECRPTSRNAYRHQRRERTQQEQAEYEHRRAQNLCYKCGAADHISRQCPERNCMTSLSGSNRLPGIPNHNIELSALQRTEDLRGIAETTEELGTLNIGMMDLPNDGGSSGPYVTEFGIISDTEDKGTSLLDNISSLEVRNNLEHTLEYFSGRNKEKLALNDRIVDIFRWTNQCRAASRINSISLNDKHLYLPAFYESAESLYFDQVRRTEWQRKLRGHKTYTRMGDVYRAKLLVALNFYSQYIQYQGLKICGRLHRGDNSRFSVKHLSNEYYEIRDDYAKFNLKVLGNTKRQGIDTWWADSMLWRHEHSEWTDDHAELAGWLMNSCFSMIYEDHITVSMGNPPRFLVEKYTEMAYLIIDNLSQSVFSIGMELLHNPFFDPVGWVHKRLGEQRATQEAPLVELNETFLRDTDSSSFRSLIDSLELFATRQVPMGIYPTIERNSSGRRDAMRSVPRPLVIVVKVNGHPVQALLDSGSLGDFMSSNLAQQLAVKRVELANPVNVQMAVQGSRTKVNYSSKVSIQYQEIREERYFDIINLSNYDLILGTPFLYQHRVSIALEPPAVVIGSIHSMPMHGERVTKLSSQSMSVYEENIDEVRKWLTNYAQKICKKAMDTPLPPLREINHEIPLIDPHKSYSWRASKCPDKLCELWNVKKNAYVRSGRWELRPASNAIPMLLLPKPSKPGELPKLRTVCDLRERNQNTRKLSSPLPDTEGILRRFDKAKYRSTIDLSDAYEQICVRPDHVECTAMNTPSGTMVSHVMQQGDCNASAMFQMIMTRILEAYLGRELDNLLDDLLVGMQSLKEHVELCVRVIDLLEKHQFWVNPGKLRFLEREFNVLGLIVNDDGIMMDPHKVDALAKWKMPTNRDLLRGFLGLAGYLADNIDRVRVPMGILHELTGNTVPFRWEFTHQRAFQEVKDRAVACRGVHRKPLDYNEGAPPINMVTDGCLTGIAGVVSQGHDWKTGRVAAFFSAKLKPVQQNYLVHKIELLASYETMLRHRDILFGTHFWWYTDHKGLIHLLKQQNLSGRQARWLEKMNEFDFEIIYVPGTENILSDALSRIYSNDSPGTVRAPSEYTFHDVVDVDRMPKHLVTMPLLVGLEGGAELMALTRSRARQIVSHESVPLAERMEGEDTGDNAKPSQKAQQGTQTERKLTIKLPARPPGMMRSGEKQDVQATAGPTSADVTRTIDENRLASRPKVNNDTHVSIPTGAPTTPIAEVLKGGRERIDLYDVIQKALPTDMLFKDVLANPKHYRNFVVKEGLLYLKDKGAELLCVPDTRVQGRSIREVIISEVHSMLNHFNSRKTLIVLRDTFWWKDMVPTYPWENIGIDFVGPLPESSDRNASYDAITVIIDRLTGMVHLVPSRQNYSAKQVAELVFAEVYRLHGLPRSILKMSIDQLLRICASPTQRDWVTKLPSVEFAINAVRSEVTGFAPFFLNYGRIPRSFVWNDPSKEEYPGVRAFTLKMKNAVMSAHDSIIAHRIKEV
ncbi:hypothetical protein NP233_g10090 [Leucocoprinus birnbaumii]|uniref:RNA-directed DNA polymerase n=1 Tax=Leucocoprinus birnbaumii TaxID=56174 RepID=A0AAD5YMH2_9AGAR|nr:hypothetical protein NP233_g10090 [Leucocoprinus birnbaumii]